MFFNSLKPPFKDNLNLRLAVQYGIDRDALGRALGGPLGVGHGWEFVPGELGFSRDVPAYSYDPEKAKKYLAAAGVADGFEVSLTAHARETDIQQAEVIQAMLGKVGINVKLDIVERTAWGAKVKIDNNFEMATRRTGPTTDMASALLVTWSEAEAASYHRAHVPGLMEKLKEADAESDGAKRAALLGDAQQLMHDSAWLVYMWYEAGAYAYNKRMQGVPASLWLENFEEYWWIDE